MNASQRGAELGYGSPRSTALSRGVALALLMGAMERGSAWSGAPGLGTQYAGSRLASGRRTQEEGVQQAHHTHRRHWGRRGRWRGRGRRRRRGWRRRVGAPADIWARAHRRWRWRFCSACWSCGRAGHGKGRYWPACRRLLPGRLRGALRRERKLRRERELRPAVHAWRQRRRCGWSCRHRCGYRRSCWS